MTFNISKYRKLVDNIMEQINSTNALLNPLRSTAYKYMKNHNAAIKLTKDDHIVMWDIDETPFSEARSFSGNKNNPLTYMHIYARKYGLYVYNATSEEVKELQKAARENDNIVSIWGYDVEVINET